VFHDKRNANYVSHMNSVHGPGQYGNTKLPIQQRSVTDGKDTETGDDACRESMLINDRERIRPWLLATLHSFVRKRLEGLEDRCIGERKMERAHKHRRRRRTKVEEGGNDCKIRLRTQQQTQHVAMFYGAAI